MLASLQRDFPLLPPPLFLSLALLKPWISTLLSLLVVKSTLVRSGHVYTLIEADSTIVTKGDTCQSIASKHHVTKGHLAEWTKKLEPSFDCDKIKPGQFICVDVKHIARH